MEYRSQFGEDYLLWHFFEQRTHGFFVDVGAFDGQHLSNSWLFEQVGWNGICVEPYPKFYELCKQTRPDTICIHAACVGDPEIKSVNFMVEEFGLFSRVKNDVCKSKKTFEEIQVPATTLDQILKPCTNKIDFLSVDVEGTEVSVLQGLDFEVYRPRLIIAEANNPVAQKRLNAFLITKKEYTYAGTLGVNRFYTNDPKDASKLRSIAIDCTVASDHPLTEVTKHRKVLKTRLQP